MLYFKILSRASQSCELIYMKNNVVFFLVPVDLKRFVLLRVMIFSGENENTHIQLKILVFALFLL